MKFKINNKYFRWGLTVFLVVAASILFYYFMFHSSNIKAGIHTITGILMPVVWGFAIAYLLTPVLNCIEKKALFPLCSLCHIKESKKRNSTVTVEFLFFSVKKGKRKKIDKSRVLWYNNVRNANRL